MHYKRICKHYIYVCVLPHLYRLLNGFSKYIIDPDYSVSYDIVQSYANETFPKITSPALCNWRETLVNIPEKKNYTHMFEYLVKRKRLCCQWVELS